MVNFGYSNECKLTINYSVDCLRGSLKTFYEDFEVDFCNEIVFLINNIGLLHCLDLETDCFNNNYRVTYYLKSPKEDLYDEFCGNIFNKLSILSNGENVVKAVKIKDISFSFKSQLFVGKGVGNNVVEFNRVNK